MSALPLSFREYPLALHPRSGRFTLAGWRCGSNCMYDAFSARNQECQGRIFTERLPNVVAPYARRTTRLCDLLTLIGFAMGGEAGNSLVERMGLEASPQTLLRLVRKPEERQIPTPRVLVWMIFVFAAAGAMERSSSISNGGFPSTCFPIEKPRRSKSGGFPIPVWRKLISRDRGGSFARCGKERSAQSQAGRRSLALTQKSLGDDAEALFASRATSAQVLDPAIGSRSAARGQTASSPPA